MILILLLMIAIIKRSLNSGKSKCRATPMEALIYGGHKLYVHLCLLFNMFLKTGYQTGNLADINNYRAIAISTALSKLLSL